MKLKGVELKGPNVVTIVIPRGEDAIVFKAKAIMENDEFDKLVAAPTPPKRKKPGGVEQLDYSNPNFKLAVQQYNNKRTAWFIIRSLEATENLQWERVVSDDPDTWLEWEKELKEAHFSQAEIGLILNGVMQANNLDSDKIEEARRNFIARELKAQEEANSQQDAPTSTPSSEPVSA